METKEKVEFYVNQDVFDYTFKFGTVVQINQTANGEKYLVVNFEKVKNSVYYDLTGRLIIMNQGYIHTRAVNPTLAMIGVLKDFRENSEGLKYFYPFNDRNIDYEYFEPISDEEYQKYLRNLL